MPSCIVKGCIHKSGQKALHPDVVMHPFPHNREQIKNWVLQTGQYTEDLETMTDRIVKGLKHSSFRMCSKHFTENCYMMKNTKKVLKPNAVPTIFPTIPRPTVITAQPLPVLLPPAKRQRVDNNHEEQQPSTSTTIVRIVSRLATVSTQTKARMFANYNVETMDIYKNVGIQNTVVMKDMSTQTHDVAPTDVPSTTKDRPYPVFYPVLVKPESMPGMNKITSILQSPSVAIQFVPPTRSALMGNGERSSVEDRRDEATFKIQERAGSRDEGTTTGNGDYIKQRKFIVYEDQLDLLLRLVRCQHRSDPPCQAPITRIKKRTDGSLLNIQLCCLNGHDSLLWNSQPTSGEFSIGNVALANSMVLVGSTYQRMKEFFQLMNIPLFSRAAFYKYQKEFIFSAIDIQWKKERAEIKQSLAGKAVALAGDGQFDRPSHSATYCTYSMMELMSKKIIDFKIRRVGPGKKSDGMEISLHSCLKSLKDEKINVRIVATDRHDGIKKLMRTKFEGVDHQFDVRHICRSLRKKLLAASRKKNCGDVAFWIRPITNHMWWAAQTCRQNADLLVEKWKSVLFHISNEHAFPSFVHYKKCQHRRIMAAQRRSYRWIGPAHPAHSALRKIIMDPLLLRDLRKVGKFCHTGELENFRGKLIKYRPKCLSFNRDSAIARTCLGVLAHNRNVHRQEVVKKMASLAKPIYDAVVDDHLFDILSDSIDILTGKLTHRWPSETKSVPKNIATSDRPIKSEVIANHVFQFSHS
ncbi:hypothetical protein XENTR_v10010257 [Xenopus tropicalis]|uniref:Uncharacterized LOC100489710 n=1 Tax=Xenopus tropicalis TaxID=8364 RepID=A0A803K8B1_XENTR|nr:uncharacterized protein LOC100489710 [Xenopus tropicalis]KAE8620449.1 hypothetical protein XENTR_v10010257 [Xenopus tropicalis]